MEMKKQIVLTLNLVLLAFASAFAVELKFNTQDFSPFSYQVNSVVAGPATDIIRAVCQKIEVDCSFKLMVWADAQKEVRDGKANAMYVIGWNKARANWLYFSPQILQTQYGFFVAKGNSLTFKEVRDLSGYRVGVYGPSNTSKSLEEVKVKMEKDKTMEPIVIDLQPDDILTFKDLDSPQRTVTAVYSNQDVGNAIIRREKLQNLRYAGAHKVLEYFIGFSKKHTDKKLVERFNVGYIQLYLNGEIAAILKRYDMVPATIEQHIIAYFMKLAN
jgi:polar amino acid transport system substrate-binding protein